jgi:murein L,D-transpeptidase YcbB/YkuD
VTFPQSLLDPILHRQNRSRFDADTKQPCGAFRSGTGSTRRQARSTHPAALNVPAEKRVEQLRANLWRAQHAPASGRGRVIVVNIPDYRLARL